MSLRQTTREIIARVEQVSGIPVYVTQNANLPTLASVQMARGAMPAHVVTCKPSAGEPPDYLIVLAFKQIAPEQDIGFDLSAEHKFALEMDERKR